MKLRSRCDRAMRTPGLLSDSYFNLPKFDVEAADAAYKEWGFNCGPAALCAVLGMRPEELRPYLGDFEKKKYLNPKLMYEVLSKFDNIRYSTKYRGDVPCAFPEIYYSLVRVQWGGPWTRQGVPLPARQRHTHWVAMQYFLKPFVFDINAICCGGWICFKEWEKTMMPWLARQCVPEWDGVIWPTHVIEIRRG